MTLKEFIAKLQDFDQKFPNAFVLHPECYSIKSKATLEKEESVYLSYDVDLHNNKVRANAYYNSMMSQR
jgi:hypothetical protein